MAEPITPVMSQEDIDKIALKLKEIPVTLDEIKKKNEIVAESFSKMKNYFLDLGQAANISANEMKKIGEQVITIELAMKAGLKPDALNGLASSATGTSSSLAETAKTIQTMGDALKGIPGAGGLKLVLEHMGKLGEMADKARQAESGLLHMAAASGELGTMFKEIGSDMSGLDQKMTTFTNMTYDIAQSSGLSMKAVGAYALEIGKIPGALSETIKTSSDGKEQMQMLDATIKIATGTGQKFNEVITDMNRVYEQFGTRGEKAAQYIARMSDASQALQMPLEIVRTYTRGASDSFKFLGDNSQAAITILGRIGPALKDSGLGPAAIADVTKGVVSSIGAMSVAQSAFLSQTTGGVGGLQGAFKIEMLKKQGKTDEIEQMMVDSLKKQMGGKLLTLEDATKSQGNAAQFEKQILLMTQGPMKMAEGKDQAMALSEALSKGLKSSDVPIKKADDALKSSLEKGNAIQDRNHNVMTTLVTHAERQVSFAAISANNLIRLAGGQQDPALKDYLTHLKANSSESAASRKMLTKGDKGVLEVSSDVGMSEARKQAWADKSKLGDSIIHGKEMMAARGVEMKKQNIAAARIPSPRGNVAKDIKQPAAIAARGASPEKSTSHTSVTVTAVCAKCNAKIAEDIAHKVSKEEIRKDHSNHSAHNHGAAH